MKTVIIDCGHGGLTKEGVYTTAPSKMAIVNGKPVYEGHINRMIGGMLGILLEWEGVNTVYTVHPNDPTDLPLDKRVSISNSYDYAPTISIHCNASKDGTARGFEIFTSTGWTQSDVLAEDIAVEVEKYYKNVGLKLRFDTSDGDRDKEVDFYVLRKTIGVAVLLECLFFDNILDYARLNDLEFRQNLVAAIFRGVMKFLNREDAR